MSVLSQAMSAPEVRRWTKAEYLRLVDEGYFEGQRVQLLEGEIVQMPGQGHIHFSTMCRVYELLRAEFGSKYWVRMQGPLDPAGDSLPEPDIAVVRGTIEEYKDHPSSAALVVEIADSSLQVDRRKAQIYAKASVGEYWIVDVNNKRVEIYRDPVLSKESIGQLRYPKPRILREWDSIAPLARPKAIIPVKRFFE